MRRKLYFFLEKLEIKRSERIAISSLLMLLVFSIGFWTWSEPYANYDEQEYAEIQKVFEERSRARQEEMKQILARYEPDPTTERNPASKQVYGPDSVNQDTSKKKRTGRSISGSININEATFEQLQELPGIGPAYARRILEWIKENGKFTSKEQLLEIRGIGEKRLAKIEPLITL